jgi:hypothetical protein
MKNSENGLDFLVDGDVRLGEAVDLEIGPGGEGEM